MLGTPEQPWINCDPYIDIDRLKSLEMDIIKGICLTADQHYITHYGPNVLDHPNFYRVHKHLNQLPIDDPDSLAYHEIVKGTENKSHLRAQAVALFTKLRFGVVSGGSYVLLRREKNYLLKNRSEACEDTPLITAFPSLMSFIRDLPFVEVGRILIFLNDHNLGTPIHTDDIPQPHHRNEFLWMSTNNVKPFFIYDPESNTKHFVTSHTAFFNEQRWHGSDPVPTMNFSIRVDGVFTEQFREQIGISGLNNYAG